MVRLLFIVFFISVSTFAQVGINTTNPNATLDIRSSNQASPASNDGLLIPRVDNFPTVNPTTNQNGMLVFVTGNGIPNKGFYYWDQLTISWVLITGASNATAGNTLDQAYDEGGLGLGKTIEATDGAVRINGDDGFLITGTFGTGNSIDTEITGNGTRLFFNPNKAAFRAGRAAGNRWDDVNIGTYSAAFGVGTTASGNASNAFGLNATASGNYTLASGFQTTASGTYANAFGNLTVASGDSSVAFGDFTTASGIASIASGLATTASGFEATALGFGTIASGDDSTALGFNTQALGFASTSTGLQTIASGDSSASFGQNTVASGFASTAFGLNTTASGTFVVPPFTFGGIATAFGINTTASGTVSTAFGSGTVASAGGATSFGSNTEASGGISTAFGQDNIASGFIATAFGNNNIATASTSMVFGQENLASGIASTAFGQETQATAINATAFGFNSLASSAQSTAFGQNTVASGYASTAFGYDTQAPSSHETVIGSFNSLYTPVVSGLGYSLQDRLFVVGNCKNNTSRCNALNIYKSGLLNINDAYDMPIADGNANQVMTTNGAGVISFQDITSTVFTLNQAYSQGGTGNGRIINAINGPVEIQNNGGLIVSSFNQPNMLFVDGTNDTIGVGTAAPTATLSVNGTTNKPGGGTWSVFSDARLKENINSYDEGLEFIKKVRPVSFSYNSKMKLLLGENRDIDHRVFQGVIAQDLQKIAPDMVREISIKAENFLEVDPNKFTYALINAVQEQQVTIENQNNKIKQLEFQLKKQQQDVEAIKILLENSSKL